MDHKFASNFAALRKEKGLTQSEVAERLHVSPQAVSKWENGDSMPDISLLPEIAKLLGTSIDSLLGVAPEVERVEVVEPPKGDYSNYFLRVIIDDDGDKVRVNLPLAIVVAIMDKAGEMQFGKVTLTKADITRIIDMVEQGVVGDIVSIEGKDGETVKVFVEKKE